MDDYHTGEIRNWEWAMGGFCNLHFEIVLVVRAHVRADTSSRHTFGHRSLDTGSTQVRHRFDIHTFDIRHVRVI